MRHRGRPTHTACACHCLRSGHRTDLVARLLARALTAAGASSHRRHRPTGVIPGQLLPSHARRLYAERERNTLWTFPLLQARPMMRPGISRRSHWPGALPISWWRIPLLRPVPSANWSRSPAHPGELNFGGAARAVRASRGRTVQHHVERQHRLRPDKSTGQAVIALLGNQVHIMFASAPSVAHISGPAGSARWQ